MGKDIFDSIIEKNYDELSPIELAEIAPFCSDEQSFLAMKDVLSHTKTIANGPKLTPQASQKDALDETFVATYGQSSRRKFYMQPFVQVAAAVLIGFAVWFFFDKSPEQPIQMAETNVEEVVIKTEDTIPATEKDTGHAENNATHKEIEIRVDKNVNAQLEQPLTRSTQNKMEPVTMHEKVAVRENFSSTNDFEISVAPSPATEAKTSYRTQSVSADYISSNSDSNPFSLKVVYSVSLEKQKKVLDFLVPQY